MCNKPIGWLCIIVVGCGFCPAVDAGDGIDPNALNVIIPQSRFYGLNAISTITVRVTEVQASIEVRPNTATITLALGLENLSHQPQELQLLIPVQFPSIQRSLNDPHSTDTFETHMLTGDKAQQTLMDLVTRVNNPGPVEFLGYDLIQSEPSSWIRRSADGSTSHTNNQLQSKISVWISHCRAPNFSPTRFPGISRPSST